MLETTKPDEELMNEVTQLKMKCIDCFTGPSYDRFLRLLKRLLNAVYNGQVTVHGYNMADAKLLDEDTIDAEVWRPLADAIVGHLVDEVAGEAGALMGKVPRPAPEDLALRIVELAEAAERRFIEAGQVGGLSPPASSEGRSALPSQAWRC